MRIECDKCSTAFIIDDALITERGIRAQCPRCGTQKIVRKPPRESAALTGAMPSPFDTMSQEQQSSAASSLAGLNSLFGSAMPPPSANVSSSRANPISPAAAMPNKPASSQMTQAISSPFYSDSSSDFSSNLPSSASASGFASGFASSLPSPSMPFPASPRADTRNALPPDDLSSLSSSPFGPPAHFGSQFSMPSGPAIAAPSAPTAASPPSPSFASPFGGSPTVPPSSLSSATASQPPAPMGNPLGSPSQAPRPFAPPLPLGADPFSGFLPKAPPVVPPNPFNPTNKNNAERDPFAALESGRFFNAAPLSSASANTGSPSTPPMSFAGGTSSPPRPLGAASNPPLPAPSFGMSGAPTGQPTGQQPGQQIGQQSGQQIGQPTGPSSSLLFPAVQVPTQGPAGSSLAARAPTAAAPAPTAAPVAAPPAMPDPFAGLTARIAAAPAAPQNQPAGDPFAMLGMGNSGANPFSPMPSSITNAASNAASNVNQNPFERSPTGSFIPSEGRNIANAGDLATAAFGASNNFGAPNNAETQGFAAALNAPTLTTALPKLSEDANKNGEISDDTAGLWHVRTRNGAQFQGLTLDALKNLIKQGDVRSGDDAAPMGSRLVPIESHPQLIAALRAGPHHTVKRGTRGARPLNIAGIAGTAVVVAALAAGGYAIYRWMPENLTQLFQEPKPTIVSPFEKVRKQWQAAYPDIEGASLEHVARARNLMYSNTASGFRDANDHFRKAIVLDDKNISAIVGYVENLANLPTAQYRSEQANLAFEGVEFAYKVDPDNLAIRRAQGALELSVGNFAKAQQLLREVTTKAPQDAIAQSLLARAFLDRLPQESQKIASKVLKLAPVGGKDGASAQQEQDAAQANARIILAASKRRLGIYREARAELMQAYKENNAHPFVLRELALLEIDLDKPQESIKWLNKLIELEEQDIEAHLLRAKIQGIVLGDLKTASKNIDFVLEKYEKNTGDLLLPLLSYGAYLEQSQKNLDKARSYIERALPLAGNYAPAHYVAGRVYAASGDLEKAQKEYQTAYDFLTKAQSTVYAPLMQLKVADVMAQRNQFIEASKLYKLVYDNASSDVRAVVGLASVYARLDDPKQRDGFITLLRKSSPHIDPHVLTNNLNLSDYPMPPEDLAQAAESIAGTNIDESYATTKRISEGFIRYHAGQRAKARELFMRAYGEDKKDLIVLLYLGVIALDEGNTQQARFYLEEADKVSSGNNELVQVYLAEAEIKLGSIKEAVKRLDAILSRDPAFLPALLARGHAAQAMGDKVMAEDFYTRVLKNNGDMLPAKKALASL